MTDVDGPLPWRFLVLPFVALACFLMVVGELRGGPLLSPTAVVALPIAFVLCAGVFAYLRHRERVDPGRNEQRLRAIYRVALAATLARFLVDLVADPSWGNLLVVAGLGAVAYSEWRSHRRERERAVAA